MNKVIIATCDGYTKEIIKNCVLEVNPKANVIDATKDEGLLYILKAGGEDVMLFFDKFFLSYGLRLGLTIIKAVNPNIRIFFCELGECSRHFGMRVHAAGADGFFCDIEDQKSFVANLRTIRDNGGYYPEIVKESIQNNDHINYRKCCNEVTEHEMRIGIFLGQGKSLKEISGILDGHKGTVAIHVHRLKCKVGFKAPQDFNTLNKQLVKTYIRSWKC